jgi:hypothetical protein
MSSSSGMLTRVHARGRRELSGRGLVRRVGVIAVGSVCSLLMFAGAAAAQTVTTGAPVAVTTTGAQVSITFNPGGATVGYQLLVGPTGGPLTPQGGLNGPFSGTADITQTVGVTNLNPSTSYTYQAQIVEFDNDATTMGNTATFTTTATPTGPGTPIVPPQNPATNGLFGFCATDAVCVADLNGDNALQGGVPPVALPTNWSMLTGAEQLYVATNLERVALGEAPIANLVNTYDAAVQTGVQNDTDPAITIGQTAVWAGAFPTPLGAVYGWLDNDGPGGANFDCTTPTSPGCFGHRDALLSNAAGFVGNPNEFDAVDGPDASGNTGYAAIVANNPNPTPAANIVLSWASEQQFLAPPPLGGLAPHGARPKLSHLRLRPSSLKALRGRKEPGVVLITQSPKHVGTVVSYSDSLAATSTFTIARGATGVIRHGRCVVGARGSKGTRKAARACIRYTTLGSFSHVDVAGTNRFRFLGRLNGRRLHPGVYRMTVAAISAHGRAGAPVSLPFTIVR